jgi:transposase-like protein
VTTEDVTKAQEQVRKWLTKRDEGIRALHAGGMSFRAIAEAVGMTHAGVAKIVRR